jgi:enoyl-CoA hydratase
MVAPMTDLDVLCTIDGGVGRITLNRPGALHALTTEMCALMTRALLAWRGDAAVSAVIIDHAGERGFCAGGDIRRVSQSGAGDGKEARAFFHTEYRLNHLLFSYPKPLAAFMDGITMGGGVGLSLPCGFRVATERTTFAMPETGIGLFPDVGGGWFLPRLPGKTGLWIALTGARLKAADCLALGLATHVLPSAGLPAVKAAIESEPSAIADILDQASSSPGPAPTASISADIDRLFSGASVEEIFAKLEADGGEWARSQLAILKTKSPQAMKVSFRQLEAGAHLPDFAADMVMEYRLGARVAGSHDFIEGVRAVIVDKDNAPRWSPETLEGVTDEMLDRLFAPLPPGEEWTPLTL